MLEYNINSDNIPVNDVNYIFTKLKDGHYSVIFPCDNEVEFKNGKYVKRPTNDIMSINTLNHLAVPKDAKDSEWFLFLDPDFEFNNENNVLGLNNSADIKTKEYSKYCEVPVESEEELETPFIYRNISDAQYDLPSFDSAKLYFSSGYDFSDIYGMMFRLYVERNDNNFLDLSNIFLTRSNAYKYLNFMAKPIVFGDVIYDRFIELKFFSTSYLGNNETIISDLNIKENAPIKLMFSYIENESKEISDLNLNPVSLFSNNDDYVRNVVCEFTRTSSIKGTIPVERLNSDNLGVYITANPKLPYVEFYGTWKDEPLTNELVNKFNLSIPLYDRNLIRRGTVTYEVDEDYVAGNGPRWVAQHEIECKLVNVNNEIIKSESYTQSQVFLPTNNNYKFYYRPIFFDDACTQEIINNSSALIINYTIRLMNIPDSVQIVKRGSISISENLGRFCARTSLLSIGDIAPKKVYNKIVKQEQTISGANTQSNLKTKYIKMFYNSTNIFLDSNGNTADNGTYTLQLSQAPKSYKFMFKQEDINGNKNYLDLTGSYYKLYTRDANKKEIIIEPTYSSNMNLTFGELEFNIGSNNLIRLKDVPVENRVMSIVVCNSDNSISSMYDMRYSFI